MFHEIHSWKIANVLDPRLHSLARKLETKWISRGAIKDSKFEERYGWNKRNGMTIENRMYRHELFTSLHMELAVVQSEGVEHSTRYSFYNMEEQPKGTQKELQVLHCLAMPRSEYEFPIFGADIIVRGGNCTLCVVDTSPTGTELPKWYAERVESLQRSILDSKKERRTIKVRRVPTWAAEIFSPLSISVRPSSSIEADLFIEYVERLHHLHWEYGQEILEQGVDPDLNRRKMRIDAMCRYNERQRENDKTRHVLSANFDEAFAEEYISSVLFNNQEIMLG